METIETETKGKGPASRQEGIMSGGERGTRNGKEKEKVWIDGEVTNFLAEEGVTSDLLRRAGTSGSIRASGWAGTSCDTVNALVPFPLAFFWLQWEWRCKGTSGAGPETIHFQCFRPRSHAPTTSQLPRLPFPLYRLIHLSTHTLTLVLLITPSLPPSQPRKRTTTPTTCKMASSHSQTGCAFPRLESPLSTSPPTSSYHPPLPPSFHPSARFARTTPRPCHPFVTGKGAVSIF
ncbi:hypothetical protein EDB83DRAFT_2320294 [Lactarius deliciosus]|nr:hypothetical protein EDB83DRAFT_2320294 [Lactarius deliciosus]